MSYLEFGSGDIGPRSFTLGPAFHRPPKPPFSWFAWVTARERAIAHASCQGLILNMISVLVVLVLLSFIVIWIGLLTLIFLLFFKACVRYFSLFLKDKCISSLVRTKYIEKKFTFHCFTNIYSLLGYHALPASLKLLV